MCLILFAHGAHPAYPLVVAANRDEWFRRPTAPAAFWPDAPDIFAGRDLEQRGTWLGITKRGRFAAVTNYRDPTSQIANAPSRGQLVSKFLLADAAPVDYLAAVLDDARRYNGFSLLVGDTKSLCYLSNREGEVRTLAPGVYGLSNHLLDVPWPKVQRGKARLADQLPNGVGADALLQLLDDTTLAADNELPSTGVSLDWERKLSSLRIVADGYGTRSSTALLVHANHVVDFVERSFDERGTEIGRVSQQIRLDL
jgi:uncharacterized protein with NRDE domain